MTPAGRSVFYDLFPPEKAAEMEMCGQLLIGLEQWLERGRMIGLGLIAIEGLHGSTPMRLLADCAASRCRFCKQ